jgi:hypothetical protein
MIRTKDAEVTHDGSLARQYETVFRCDRDHMAASRSFALPAFGNMSGTFQ